MFMDQALAAIHQASGHGISLRILRHEGQVALAIEGPAELDAMLEGQLYAQFPECRLVAFSEPAERSDAVEWSASLVLRPELFPIRTYAQFEDTLTRQVVDPLSATMTAIGAASKELDPSVEIGIVRANSLRIHRLESCVRILARPFLAKHHGAAKLYRLLHLSRFSFLRWVAWHWAWFIHESPLPKPHLNASGSRYHDREDDLAAANEKAGKLLFETSITIRVAGKLGQDEAAIAKIREIAGTFGQFASPRRTRFRLGRIRYNRVGPSPTFLLATDELATLWHPPTATVRAPTMSTVESREMEPPTGLPWAETGGDLAILGTTNFRGKRRRFGILLEDRRRHLALLGKTGMGKSTLLLHLLSSDIAAERGVGLLDPHGDLCEAVLATIPKCRTNDIVFFDAGNPLHPLAFNPLHCPRPDQRVLVASGILSAFKKLYGHSWGPRMEHILRNTLLALMEAPGSTLLSVVRLLGDVRFRQHVLTHVKDPIVRNFWQQEFAALPLKLQVEATAPILNKVGHFVSSPLLRNILGQAKSKLDLRAILDEGKVLLVNLSKGRMGDDASALLGSFLVTSLQLAAMSRADTPEKDRRDFFLYVDEFQNFATDAFATILSEARKYRLALTLANQYLGQLDETTLAAVFGNIGTMISFQVGAQDAEAIATQFGGDLVASDLLRLPRYEAYIRLLLNGMPTRPFSLRTLPPPRVQDPERARIIERTSHHRFTRLREQVENEIELAMAV